MPVAHRLGIAAVGLLLALSLGVRVRNLASPLVEDHAFRQTQTAITVWTFVEEGIAPFRYQTPVFGPPWRLPFEFPLFQITAAALVEIGVANIDVACRLTNLLFFYLSAAFLYGLCRMHFQPRAASVCILMAYLWLPYMIFWSRTSMIDYCSVFLALGYACCLLRWLRSPERWHALALAVGFGCLAMLVKATTVVTIVVLLGWSVLRTMREELRGAGGWRLSSAGHLLCSRRGLLAGSVVASLVPLVVGYGWEAYAQRVRLASPTTQWFGPQNLTLWFYGTWAQRADPRFWSIIASRFWTFTPGVLAVLPCFGVWCVFRNRREGRAFLWAMLSGAFITIVTFFNLYLDHNYYLMAVSPTVAIVVGMGFYFLCFETVSGLAWKVILSGLALTVLGWTAQPYLARPFSISYATEPVCLLGQRIQEVTPPDEHVIVRDHPFGWSPEILYYARRKGLMVWGSVLDMKGAALQRYLRENRFTTLVSRRTRGNLPSVGQIGGYRITKVPWNQRTKKGRWSHAKPHALTASENASAGAPTPHGVGRRAVLGSSESRAGPLPRIAVSVAL
jgi:hypothetical protein